ncbi:hypothetical protein GCM10008022_21140 [Paenibacillus hunanensis]|nr:hypothetical protein GCM10008022_21140 [Paenibacillus hunanensis]
MNENIDELINKIKEYTGQKDMPVRINLICCLAAMDQVDFLYCAPLYCGLYVGREHAGNPFL